MDRITISVIIPTYNSKAQLGRAIESVLRQSDPLEEILVVDDGSTDGTDAMVGQCFPQVRYFRQANQGVSVARNFGAQKALGDWLAFLDADDLWFPEKQFIQKKILRRHPEAKMLTAGRVWIDRQGKVRPHRFCPKRVFRWNFWRLLSHNTIPTPSVMVEKKAFFAAKGFDEGLETGEDWDLWLKLVKNYPAFGTTQRLVGIEKTQGSLSSNRFRIMMNNIDILARYNPQHSENNAIFDDYRLYQWIVWQHTFHSLRRLARAANPQEMQEFWEASQMNLPLGVYGGEALRRYFGLPPVSVLQTLK